METQMETQMKTIGSYEAKTHLPRLLSRVVKGEQITITRRGVPIVRLIPVNPVPVDSIKEVIEKIRAFRKRHPIKGVSIQKMIQEGRKF